jgi:aspartate/glutamate racemase
MRTIGMIGGMSWESSAIYYWKLGAGGRHSDC